MVVWILLSGGYHVCAHIQAYVLIAAIGISWLARVIRTLVHEAHWIVHSCMLFARRWMYTAAVQTFVHYFTLMGEFSGIRLLSTNHLLLPIFHILKWSRIKYGNDTYLNLLVRSNLRWVWHALTATLILSSRKLLVGWRRKTSLAERKQHLRWRRHGHYNGIACSKPSTDFLNVWKTLSWTSTIGTIPGIFCLHLLGRNLLRIRLAIVSVLNVGLLVLIITCRPTTF